MTFEEYKDVIKNGDRVEWYGVEVPSALITNKVRALADMVIDSLNHLDVEISDLRKGTKELTKKQEYYDAVYRNVQNLPYKMNGLIDDFYMAKRYQIEAEIEEENKLKKTEVKTKQKRTKTRKIEAEVTLDEVKEEVTEVKTKRGKNSKLIFGK